MPLKIQTQKMTKWSRPPRQPPRLARKVGFPSTEPAPVINTKKDTSNIILFRHYLGHAVAVTFRLEKIILDMALSPLHQATTMGL